MLTTRKSNPNQPVRVMIYGQEGVGKSTFGAKSDHPIFISPEGGTDQLTNSKGESIDEMPNIKTWDDVVGAVNLLLNQEHQFKTLVIDSADWVEKLCHAKIIGDSGKDIIRANGGYGAGYRESENKHRELIKSISLLRDKKNMHVVVVAHAHVKAVKDPSMLEDYDAFEIKCHEFVSSLWREWVDVLGFARFTTFLKTDEKQKARALNDGTRTLYTVKQPSFQAKNRYGLPAEMEFTEKTWDEILSYVYKQKKISIKEIEEQYLKYLETVKDVEVKKKATEYFEKHKTNYDQLLIGLERIKKVQGE